MICDDVIQASADDPERNRPHCDISYGAGLTSAFPPATISVPNRENDPEQDA
jgi:hypothetical protein